MCATAFLVPSVALLRPPPLRRRHGPVARNERRVCVFKCVASTFEQAVRNGYVAHFGRTLHIKSDLSVVESESLSIPHHFLPHLQRISTSIVHSLPQQHVLAVYVRGSITTAHFFEDGRSDLDLVVVTKHTLSLPARTALKRRIKAIAAQWKPSVPVDLRCVQSSSISPSLAVILRYYSLPLYTSSQCDPVPDHPNLNFISAAINIRDDQRKCMALFAQSNQRNNFTPLALQAVQWLCKRCLRSLTELAVSKTRTHARDLVPCFKLCCSAYPEHTRLLLTALQLACAHQSNEFVGLGHQHILQVGLHTVQDLVELVEHVFLTHMYGSTTHSPTLNDLQNPIVRPPLRNRVLQVTEQALSAFLFQIKKSPNGYTPFARYTLPKTSIRQFGQVAERAVVNNVSANELGLSHFLIACDEPFIVRGVMDVMESHSVVTSLVRNHLTVSCRISPTNVVTFCRSEHPWIKDNLFTPSSVLHSVSTTEAIRRLQKDCTLAPLVYKDSVREHLYIQTDAFTSETLFELESVQNVQVCQKERIWISTHGTVSSLHYDASHSALVQLCGSKRMLFFPSECLDRLGIYPLGHPLHRRARVNLDHSTSIIFRRFWAECSSLAVEACVSAGDLIVFPPNWSHYTESAASRGEELSVSHTLRYTCRTHSPMSS